MLLTAQGARDVGQGIVLTLEDDVVLGEASGLGAKVKDASEALVVEAPVITQPDVDRDLCRSIVDSCALGSHDALVA